MKYYYFLMIVFLLSACGPQEEGQKHLDKRPEFQVLVDQLHDSKDDQVLVVAHRGDWRNAPENSLQSIQNCIDMGVDMVEIDVQETKDGALILMHDKSIDRTTNGMGKVKDWRLDSLKTLYLKDHHGHITSHRIPSLEEALLLAKGKILVNLDKSHSIFHQCHEIIQKTHTQDQVIIKAAKSLKELDSALAKDMPGLNFMPIIHLNQPEAHEMINEYLNHQAPIAFEMIIPNDSLANASHFKNIRNQGSSIWVNALWPSLNGGHDDEKALLDPQVYQWYLDHHIDIIQTDRPLLLLEYLREKQVH